MHTPAWAVLPIRLRTLTKKVVSWHVILRKSPCSCSKHSLRTHYTTHLSQYPQAWIPCSQKSLIKRKKKQKTRRERQVFPLSLERGHAITQFAFQFCKRTIRSNSVNKLQHLSSNHVSFQECYRSKILSLQKESKPLKNFNLRFLSRKRHANGGAIELESLALISYQWNFPYGTPACDHERKVSFDNSADFFNTVALNFHLPTSTWSAIHQKYMVNKLDMSRWKVLYTSCLPQSTNREPVSVFPRQISQISGKAFLTLVKVISYFQD